MNVLAFVRLLVSVIQSLLGHWQKQSLLFPGT